MKPNKFRDYVYEHCIKKEEEEIRNDEIFEPDCFLTIEEKTIYNDLLLNWSLESGENQNDLDNQISHYVALAYERYIDICERKGGDHV